MMKDELIHIAIADDHVAVRSGVVALLKDMGGIAVDVQASNGRELINKLSLLSKLPSICMLDISMPDMNGFETIAAIKEKWPEMKVLVMTGFNLEHYVIRMIRYGANGYILKSCNPREIKQALVAIHEDGLHYSELMRDNMRKAMFHPQNRAVELSEVETEVLKRCCSDLSYEEIGEAMGKSKKSIEGHRDALFRKLDVTSRVGLALYAVRSGIFPIE